jgi:cytochrome b561
MPCVGQEKNSVWNHVGIHVGFIYLYYVMYGIVVYATISLYYRRAFILSLGMLRYVKNDENIVDGQQFDRYQQI